PGPLGSDDMNSWLAGAQSGCDYQFASRFVIGIQGDYAWTDAKSSHITQAIGTTRTNSSRIKSLTTVTGRLGYAWDRFLGYVKGGFAWENDNYDRVNDNTGQLFSFASETRGGWTGGVGGEYAFTDYISGFVEYNYYDFGTRTVTFTFAQPQAIPLEFIDISERKSVVRAGINIRLGLIK